MCLQILKIKFPGRFLSGSISKPVFWEIQTKDALKLSRRLESEASSWIRNTVLNQSYQATSSISVLPAEVTIWTRRKMVTIQIFREVSQNCLLFQRKRAEQMCPVMAHILAMK